MQCVPKRAQIARSDVSNPVGFSKFNWTLSKPNPEEQENPVLLLRAWHRAFLVGLEIRKLRVNGRNVTSEELRRLNFWIAAHGAWRCSALPHFEALEAIENVLHGRVSEMRIGKSGGGRVAHLAESNEQPEKAAPAKPARTVNTFPPRKRGRRRKPLEGKAAASEMEAFDRALGLLPPI